MCWPRRWKRKSRPAPNERGTAGLRSGTVRREPPARARDGLLTAKQARALEDRNPRVRALALQIVTEFSRAEAAELIAAAIFDHDPGVRCVAAECAARLQISRFVPTLLAALGDQEVEVRQAAARALESIMGMPITSVPDARRRWVERRVGELRT
jgi:HEAT repeat protein